MHVTEAINKNSWQQSFAQVIQDFYLKIKNNPKAISCLPGTGERGTARSIRGHGGHSIGANIRRQGRRPGHKDQKQVRRTETRGTGPKSMRVGLPVPTDILEQHGPQISDGWRDWAMFCDEEESIFHGGNDFFTEMERYTKTLDVSEKRIWAKNYLVLDSAARGGVPVVWEGSVQTNFNRKKLCNSPSLAWDRSVCVEKQLRWISVCRETDFDGNLLGV